MPDRPTRSVGLEERLSNRELEVLALMADGLANAAICDELFLTKKTVEGHVRSIFRKLDLPQGEQTNRRVVAVLRYLESTARAAA